MELVPEIRCQQKTAGIRDQSGGEHAVALNTRGGGELRVDLRGFVHGGPFPTISKVYPEDSDGQTRMATRTRAVTFNCFS
jgi:hypothetical protein